MNEEDLMGMLTQRDYKEAKAYFEGIAQGVALACMKLSASDSEKKEILALVESHRVAFEAGVESV